MTVTDELLASNKSYAEAFDKGDLQLPPAKKVAIVACMDARLNPNAVLGLSEGDGHVIRNAGGVISDDVIRSLSISQHLLGTEEIILIHHTDCGMLTFTDEEFAEKLQDQTGQQPPWSAQTFDNVEEDLRRSILKIRESPFLPSNRKSVLAEQPGARLRLRRCDRAAA